MSDPAGATPPEPRPPQPPVAPADAGGGAPSADPPGDGPVAGTPRKRRRGSRGGRGRGANRSRNDAGNDDGGSAAADRSGPEPRDPELPDPPGEGRVRSVADEPGVASGVEPVRRPRIGDTRPAPATAGRGRTDGDDEADDGAGDTSSRRRRRRGGRGRTRSGRDGAATEPAVDLDEGELIVDPELLAQRRGRERNGRPIGRYLMCVNVRAHATQIAVLEGRSLIEHYVSRPQDDVNQIDGNVYVGRVQNVLPGMEAAFVDIGTPKNAVLYRGDVRYDRDDMEGTTGPKAEARIEQLLKPGQTILCQVTKNPIGAKGARLTQEVSLPGRFVVFIPESDTYGISKRLSDDERKRLRRILDEVRPDGHGLIVRTAAEGATAEELRRDVARLLDRWRGIDDRRKRSKVPSLLYGEPAMAVRVIREEFNNQYRGVVIDDRDLYEEVRDYVASISPELADRVEYYDPEVEPLPIFERFHVHEQLHKALDRKVWLPSGGSIIIERTEALTVIDVNTGKNVGKTNLEETVTKNNLEAAEEIARQLRLRDIGGIIVIDFIDMEVAANRQEVMRAFRDALARDKTRTQVFDISELGICQMTRKRVSEGLVESFSTVCPVCDGRGLVMDESLL